MKRPDQCGNNVITCRLSGPSVEILSRSMKFAKAMSPAEVNVWKQWAQQVIEKRRHRRSEYIRKQALAKQLWKKELQKQYNIAEVAHARASKIQTILAVKVTEKYNASARFLHFRPSRGSRWD